MPSFLRIFLLLITPFGLGLPAAAATLVPRATPPGVTAAVARVYELGRNQLDVGGVASVRAFAVAGPRGSLEEVVALVVGAVKDDRESALLPLCNDRLADTADAGGAGFDRACARWLVANAAEKRALSWIGNLATELAGAGPDAPIATDLALVRSFVLDSVGANYVELGAHADLFSVDVVTAILVDPTRTRIVVLHYDAGA